MIRLSPIALLVLTVTIGSGQRLVFDRQIGTDWPLDSYRWMSFVAVSADGRSLVSNGCVPSENDRLGFWTFPEGKFQRSVHDAAVAISPDFHYAVLEKQILELQSGKSVFAVAQPKDRLDAAVFSADSQLVAVGASPDLVKGSRLTILRTSNGSVVSSLGKRFLSGMAFTPDGRTFVTGHWNNVTLWDVQTGERLALLMSPARKSTPERELRDGRYLSAITVSPDGKLIAAGSDDGELQVWNLLTRKLVHASSLSYAEISAAAFSPDSSLIATGSYEDGTLRLVEAATGRLLSEIQVSMFGVGRVAFSADGNYLVTPSNAGVLNSGKHSRGGSVRVFRLER